MIGNRTSSFRQAGSGRSIGEIRTSERLRKKAERQEAKAVWIDPPKDLAGRLARETDIFLWLPYYLPDVFRDPFQPHHVEMIRAIIAAMDQAGDQSIAGPRGEGKTTIAEGVTIYGTLTGHISFSVIFAATGTDARNSLASIKQYLAESEPLLDDYPEVCKPIREVDAVPNRAHSIVVEGEGLPLTEARFQWSGDEISMPKVPGSKCAGAIIATRGLDAAVRGLKKGTRRPQLCLIDDPDTEDTARNPDQAKKLRDRIDRAIAGLAPKGKRLSRVMLTTLQNRICASYQYTDPAQKPSWNGKRFAFLLQAPVRQEDWDEYMSLRNGDQASGDRLARRAHRFYLDRRERMDEGAIVANPWSFDGRLLADGSQLQVSAIQRYYDFVADNGIEAALSELQNDPPEESGPQESGISAYRIQRQVSGFARKVIPPDCAWLTMGVDCGKRGLHWVVRAWREDGTGYTIDYGFTETYGTKVGSDEGLDQALTRALQTRREEIEALPYAAEDGGTLPVFNILVDAGWRTETVYKFCREAGFSWKPSMGFGRSAGCAKPNFYAPVHSSPDKKVGDRWFVSRQAGNVKLVCDDADHWKAWEHDHWMRDPEKPGALLLYGIEGTPDRMSADEKGHMSYAKHLTAEVEVEEPVKGVLKRYWKAKSDTNHYFDASRLASIAASMLGVPLNGPGVKRQRGGDPGARPSAAELAAGR